MRQFAPLREKLEVRFFDEDVGVLSSIILNAQSVAPREYGGTRVEAPNKSAGSNSPNTLAIRIALQQQVLLG